VNDHIIYYRKEVLYSEENGYSGKGDIMQRKRVITLHENMLYSALFEDNRMVRLDAFPSVSSRDKAIKNEDPGTAVGDIFVAKVKDIIPNIGAAFVEIAGGERCYLSLESLKKPVFLNPKKNDILHQEDLLLVQVSREPVKTKPAVVTVNVSITGRYMVLTHGKTMVGISGKIRDEEKREHFHELLKPYSSQEYGFIVRTNALYASDEDIVAEVLALEEMYRDLRCRAQYAKCFTCLYRAPEYYLTDIRDDSFLTEETSEIITDSHEVYEQIDSFFSNNVLQAAIRLKYYEDFSMSLWNLYGMQAQLERALNKKVWLPCGGYLIIEPTEALTVIDVNTGKAVGKKKNVEEAYFKVNAEAAAEIAIQLRLRNLSGIIVVDFIDMREAQHTKQIASILKKELAKDYAKAEFIDFTALHLAEITRKKVRKPLHEQLQGKMAK